MWKSSTSSGDTSLLEFSGHGHCGGQEGSDEDDEEGSHFELCVGLMRYVGLQRCVGLKRLERHSLVICLSFWSLFADSQGKGKRSP